MDENVAGIRLGLSFNIRRGRMLIYHSTIRAIGEPEFVRFLFNSRDKRIAVQSCEAIDRDSFRVPKVTPGERFQFDISSSPFLSVVYKACHWSLEESYLVYGVNHPEHHLVEFELKDNEYKKLHEKRASLSVLKKYQVIEMAKPQISILIRIFPWHISNELVSLLHV